MRILLLFALTALVVASTGCTHLALERRTIQQASTLTDLQYQQVLDNLAMFACNPESMPWHIKLGGGTVQIADQGSGGFTADIATALGGEPTRLLPSAGVQRGILNQWDVEPVADAEELELLRLAYLKATDPANPDLDARIYKTIGELSVRFDILPKRDTLNQIFARNSTGERISERQEKLCEDLSQLIVDQVKIVAKLAEAATAETLAKAAVDARLKQVTESQKAVKDAQNPTQLETARQGLEQALKDLDKDALAIEQNTLALALGEQGRLEKQAAHLTEKLAQLRTEEVGLQETAQLVKQLKAGANLQVYGGSQAVTRVQQPKGFQLQNIREQIEALAGKKEKPADQKSLLLAAILFALDSYVPSAELREATQRNVGLIAQAEDKVRKLEELVEKFNSPWLACGKKDDVPKCACYAGRHCSCTGDCQVWVMPEQLGTLREFTLIVLALAPVEKQELFPSGGAAFSPSLR
jgi:hypothetical protein